MTEDLPVCENCKFRVRYSRRYSELYEEFYNVVVCRHPEIDGTVSAIPTICIHYECKHHVVAKDQKTLGV